MANQMALWLDREGMAEMSCIAGVGGGVAGLVQTAQSGRPVLALDGCVLACVSACVAQAGVIAEQHVLLSDQEQARDVYRREILPRALALQHHEPTGADIDANVVA